MKKALVVDDSKTARLILKKKLEHFQIAVDLAESGEEALEYLKQQSPDIIFMDVMMEGMNGYETTLAISRNPRSATIPVIMCTSKDTHEDRLEAKKNGAHGYLVKPIDDEKFSLALQEVQRSAVAAINKQKPLFDAASMHAEIETLVRDLLEKRIQQFIESGVEQTARDALATRLRVLEERLDLLVAQQNIQIATGQATQNTLATRLNALEEKITLVAAQPAPEVAPSSLSPEYLRRLEEQVNLHLQQWSAQEQTRKREHERQLQHHLKQTAERAAEAVMARHTKEVAAAPVTGRMTWAALGMAVIAIGIGITALLL